MIVERYKQNKAKNRAKKKLILTLLVGLPMKKSPNVPPEKTHGKITNNK